MSTEHALSRRHVLGLGCGLAAGGWLGRVSTIAAAAPAPATGRRRSLTQRCFPSLRRHWWRFAFLFKVGSQDDPRGRKGSPP